MAKIIEPTCVVDWDAIDDSIDDSYNFGIWNEDYRHNLTKYNRVESPYCESADRNDIVNNATVPKDGFWGFWDLLKLNS